MAEVLVVASKVKEAIKDQDCNTASDVVDALSAKVAKMIKKQLLEQKKTEEKLLEHAISK